MWMDRAKGEKSQRHARKSFYAFGRYLRCPNPRRREYWGRVHAKWHAKIETGSVFLIQ